VREETIGGVEVSLVAAELREKAEVEASGLEVGRNRGENRGGMGKGGLRLVKAFRLAKGVTEPRGNASEDSPALGRVRNLRGREKREAAEPRRKRGSVGFEEPGEQ
jgi:hypothetical protein